VISYDNYHIKSDLSMSKVLIMITKRL